MVLLQPLASAHFHFPGSYSLNPLCLYFLSQEWVNVTENREVCCPFLEGESHSAPSQCCNTSEGRHTPASPEAKDCFILGV